MNKHNQSHQWISHPIVLDSKTISLIPLEEKHLEELCRVASDKELWKLIPTDCSERDTFYKAYNFSLTERANGRQYPFVILHKPTNRLIGSTRLFEIYPDDKK